MSGEVNKVSVAQLQARIAELRNQNTEEARAEIKQCILQIGELFKQQKEPIKAGSVEISTEMGANFSVNPNIAEQPEIDRMGKYKDEAHIKEKFGDAELTDAKYEEIKKEYDEAKKALDEAQKANKKVKYSKYDDKTKFGEDKNTQFAAVEAAQERFTKAKAEYDRAKILHDVNDGDVNRGIKKAAKRNVENFTNVMNTQRVFLSKAEEEAAIVKDPSLDGKTKVLKDKDINTIMAIGQYAQYKINKAEETGDPEEIAKAKEKYGLYTEMFNKKEDGTIDFSADAINVRNAQNALVDESGFDQRFNLDEIETMSRMYGVSKGDVKSTVKKFGFGTESGHAQRWAAAGIAAGAALAGNALNWALGNTHSHSGPVKDTDFAEGETVQGEVNWIASNGETFYHYYEAKGGTAAAEAVAEACAKLPMVGQLLGPALAGVTAFFLTKPQTEDAFGGANVEAVLQDINLVEGKDNKAIVLAIQDMEITGSEAKDKAIKAAVLKAALGENTKKANTEELLAAFDQLEQAKEAIKKIEGEIKPEKPAEEEPVKPDPVKPDPVEPDPVDYDIKKEDDIEVRTELPRLKYREGTWYTSHGYVDADGKELTPAERKEVKRLLEQDANRIALVDTNGDGKADFKDRKVSLPTELELPNGKKVKIADDAYDRIMKLPAQTGNKPVNGKYGVHVAKIAGKWHVIDPKNNNKVVAGPFDTEAEAKAAEENLEAEANKPKEAE